jgi:hypothetical protein
MASSSGLLQTALASGGDPRALFTAEQLGDTTALKRAYKMMALKLHPDKNDHADAGRAFQLMQAAFEAALKLSATGARPRTAQAPPPSQSRQSQPHASQPPPTAARQPQPSAQPAGPTARPPPPPPPPPMPNGTRRKATDDIFEDFPLPPDVFDAPLPKAAQSGARASGPPPPPPPPMRTTGASSRPAPPPPPPPPPQAARAGDDTRHASRVDEDWERAGFFQTRPSAYTWTPTDGHSDASPENTQRTVNQKQPRSAAVESLSSLFAKFNVVLEDDDEEVFAAPNRGARPRPASSAPSQTPIAAESSSGSLSDSRRPAPQPVATIKLKCLACKASISAPSNVSHVSCAGCGAYVNVASALAANAASGRTDGKKKSDRCACGASKRGACFMCPS